MTVAVISYTLNIKGVKQDMIATFYFPQTRFWELLSGSLLSWIALYKMNAFIDLKSNTNKFLSFIVYSEKSDPKGQTLAEITSFAGLSLLIYGFWRINQEFDLNRIKHIKSDTVLVFGNYVWYPKEVNNLESEAYDKFLFDQVNKLNQIYTEKVLLIS